MSSELEYSVIRLFGSAAVCLLVKPPDTFARHKPDFVAWNNNEKKKSRAICDIYFWCLSFVQHLSNVSATPNYDENFHATTIIKRVWL